MGIYRDRVFPRLMNASCNTAATRRIRAEVCAPLAGEVLEIGFGTGLNLPHLPATVSRLLAVDPLVRGRALAAERIAASDVAVSDVGLDGESIDLPDDAVDAALSTWTLCSIPDPVAAVREIARVLRPGGVLHLAEHGAAPDPAVRRWQDRLNGIQKRVACGCRLNRDIEGILQDGGMALRSGGASYAPDTPKVFGWTLQGTAMAVDDPGA